MRLFLLGVLVAGAAFSAPDERSLGKAEGDPVCPPPLAGRYQYERTPQQRMTSMSMAKTIVAMLVGVALSEGKIELNTGS